MAAFEAWLVFHILVVNVVGELQRKKRLAASRGFLAAARLSCLFIMYVNQTTRLMRNGVYSSMFRVLNGVKQGGVASPVMFCVYIDELLSGLRDKGSWMLVR